MLPFQRLIFGGVVFVAVLLGASPAGGAELTWVPGPHMNSLRTAPSVTFGSYDSNNYIYAIGGVDSGFGVEHATNSAERLNEATQTWENLPSMTVKRHGGGAVTDSQGRIWVVGGCDPSGPHASVERYDPGTNSWTMMTSHLNIARAEFGIAIDATDHIYVFGGGDTSGVTQSSVEMYDPVADTWSYLAPMSAPRRSLGYGWVADSSGEHCLYAIGGHNQATGETLFSGEKYIPSENRWVGITSIGQPSLPPVRRGGAASFVRDGMIWIVGGGDGPTYFTNTSYIYDPVSDAWEIGPTMYETLGSDPRAAVGADGQTTYVCGGEGPSVWAHDRVAMLVPEPATLSVLGLGGLALLRRRRG